MTDDNRERPMIFVRRRHDGRMVSVPPDSIDLDVYEMLAAPKPKAKAKAPRRRRSRATRKE